MAHHQQQQKRKSLNGKGKTSATFISFSRDDDAVLSCPICLSSEKEERTNSNSISFASGPCRHVFCISCLESLLLVSPAPHHGDQRVFTPTLGSCPICRAELSLFSLQKVPNEELLYPQNPDLSKTPLKGCTYAYASEATFSQEQIIVSLNFSDEGVPSLNLEGLIGLLPSTNTVMDDRLVHPEFTEYYYHADSRTFAGTIVYSKLLAKILSDDIPYHYERMEIVLSFSKDFQRVQEGVVMNRRKRFNSVQDFWAEFPWDGDWVVVSSKKFLQPQGQISVLGVDESIRVANNRCYLVSQDFDLDGNVLSTTSTTFLGAVVTGSATENHRPVLTLESKSGPLNFFGQELDRSMVAERQDHDSSHPSGFSIGALLRWKIVNDTDSSEHGDDNADIVFTWKRESIATSSPSDDVDYVGDKLNGSFFRVDDNHKDKTNDTYNWWEWFNTGCCASL